MRLTAQQTSVVRGLLAIVIAVQVLVALVGVRVRTNPDADVIVGRPPVAVQQPLPGPTIPSPAVTVGGAASAGAGIGHDPTGVDIGRRPEPPPAPEMRRPDSAPYRPAIPFDDADAPPMHEGLVFVLVAGSDARPGESLERSRADSVHLLALNPQSGTGTVLGFPRDAWVEIPGHGKGKLNSALAIGGPDLLSETVQRLTGLPVHWWVLTGFDGLVGMVDELGGLTVEVRRRMADRASGAYFERGWHHLSGREVLAFSRDRTSVERGDLSRSENQGLVILAALSKMRVEVGDMGGVRAWVEVLWRHVRIDASVDDAVRLGATARRTDPERLVNVVAPGRVGTAGRASVVYLTDEARAIFEDLRDDATIGDAPPPTTTTTSTSTTTTTSTSSTTSTTTTTVL